MSIGEVSDLIERVLAELEAEGATVECASVREALAGGLDPQLAYAELQRELVRRQVKREQQRLGGGGG